MIHVISYKTRGFADFQKIFLQGIDKRFEQVYYPTKSVGNTGKTTERRNRHDIRQQQFDVYVLYAGYDVLLQLHTWFEHANVTFIESR